VKEKYITVDPSSAPVPTWREGKILARPKKETEEESGKPLKHRGSLITRVARSSFTYRGRYTLAYFKPAIFQHLRYTSMSNLHEPTIRDLFRPTFGLHATPSGKSSRGRSPTIDRSL